MVTQERKNKLDPWYKDLMRTVVNEGVDKEDRTGTGTKSTFGHMFKHSMKDGFPLLTSKKMFMKGVTVELLWFLGAHMALPYYQKLGRTNIKYLVDNKCDIWVGDCYKKYKSNPENEPMDRVEFAGNLRNDYNFALNHGQLGMIYGAQWRAFGGKQWFESVQHDVLCEKVDTLDEVFDALEEEACEMPVKVNTNIKEVGGIDQIYQLIEDLKSNPDSRRLIVSAWNPNDLDKMVLPPCHYGFQCYTRELTKAERVAIWDERYLHTVKVEDSLDPIDLDGDNIPKRELSLSWNQRSVDVPLGLPFNIASYGLLLHILADQVNMVPGDLIGYLGDTHVYMNQIEPALEQLNNPEFPLPQIAFKSKENLLDYEWDDFTLVGYESAGKVNYPLSN